MVARGWCTYSTNHRSTCIVDDRHTHGTAPNNYPKPALLHLTPGPKMMNYEQGVQVKATKNPGAVIQPCPVLRRYTKMLRRSLGSPPAQRHPRQACLGPRFCFPATLHSLGRGGGGAVYGMGSTVLVPLGGGQGRAVSVPPPPLPSQTFARPRRSRGKREMEEGESRSRVGGRRRRPRCLSVWLTVWLASCRAGLFVPLCIGPG